MTTNPDTKLLQVDSICDIQVIKLELFYVIANGSSRKLDRLVARNKRRNGGMEPLA